MPKLVIKFTFHGEPCGLVEMELLPDGTKLSKTLFEMNGRQVDILTDVSALSFFHHLKKKTPEAAREFLGGDKYLELQALGVCARVIALRQTGISHKNVAAHAQHQARDFVIDLLRKGLPFLGLRPAPAIAGLLATALAAPTDQMPGIMMAAVSEETVPSQAADLSTVFDTINEMHDVTGSAPKLALMENLLLMMLRRAASNREELLAETDKLKTELAAQTKLREKEIEDQLKRAEMLEKDVSGLKKDMLEVKKEVVEIKSTQEEHTRQLRRHSEDHGELLAMYQELARDVKDNHQSMEGMKEDMAKNKKDTAEALLLAQKALLLQAVTDLQLAEVDLNFNRFAGKVDALEQLVVKLQNDIPDLKGVIERKTSSMMRLGADETKARIAAMYAVQERLGQVEKGLTVVEVEVKEAVTEAGEAHKRADEAYTLADKARALAAAVATSAGNAMEKLDDLQSKDVPKILTVIASFGEKLGRLEEAVKESPELVNEIEKKVESLRRMGVEESDARGAALVVVQKGLDEVQGQVGGLIADQQIAWVVAVKGLETKHTEAMKQLKKELQATAQAAQKEAKLANIRVTKQAEITSGLHNQIKGHNRREAANSSSARN